MRRPPAATSAPSSIATISPTTDHAPRHRTATDAPPDRLQLGVRSAVGYGPTELAAFDAALREAGIANFNLIVLSSVIPPGSEVRVLDDPGAAVPDGEWGDRLYVVMAEAATDVPGREIAAGLGWVQDPESGRGLFVEHERGNAARVRRDIDATLGAMVAGRPESFGPIQRCVRDAVGPADGSAVCVLVTATYRSEPWSR